MPHPRLYHCSRAPPVATGASKEGDIAFINVDPVETGRSYHCLTDLSLGRGASSEGNRPFLDVLDNSRKPERQYSWLYDSPVGTRVSKQGNSPFLDVLDVDSGWTERLYYCLCDLHVGTGAQLRETGHSWMFWMWTLGKLSPWVSGCMGCMLARELPMRETRHS